MKPASPASDPPQACAAASGRCMKARVIRRCNICRKACITGLDTAQLHLVRNAPVQQLFLLAASGFEGEPGKPGTAETRGFSRQFHGGVSFGFSNSSNSIRLIFPATISRCPANDRIISSVPYRQIFHLPAHSDNPLEEKSMIFPQFSIWISPPHRICISGLA